MADNMLGTLAKWLRVAGVDCDYASGMDDASLVDVSARGRIVLTRDRDLARRCGDAGVYVASDVLEQQLLQVLRVLPDVLAAEPLSRCIVCNVPIVDASPEDVRSRVPPGVRDRTSTFWSCPRCGRVYWEGSHVGDMEARLSAILRLARAVEGGPPAEGG
jgi:uncharacterized protein with PIN domain